MIPGLALRPMSRASSPATPGAMPTGPQPSVDALYLGDALLEAMGQRPHPRLYPYFLGVNRLGTTQVPASGTVSEQVPVGGDAAFLASGLIASATTTFLLTLKWSHLSGAAFSQIGMHSRALFGTLWQPFVFPRPQLMPHDATLTVEITNLATYPIDASVYLYGFKVMR